MNSQPSLTEPSRQTPVFGEYDVVVLGGGPAGIAAAVAASRAGRSTLLIERYGFLGGMGTAAGVTNFCGLHANVHGEIRQVVHGVAQDLLSRIDRLGGLNEPHALFGKTVAQAYDTAAYKIAADDLMNSAGVQVLFHALAAGVLMESPARVKALLVETKSGRRAIVGRSFIDCSGDGDLAAWAGAPYEKGDGAGNMLYPSTMFRLNGIDPERAGKAWEIIPRMMLDAEAAGRYRFPRKTPIVRPQKSGIEWRVNLTQLANAQGNAMDGTDAVELSEAEMLGRRQIAGVAAFLKEVPGFENSYIVDIAPQVGIRETRRVQGRYMLTESDVLECASFDDTVGVNGWPL
ncbi:MAG TPA: FAD-dependent oxidoreductase, partial [Ramlibacter sp.]|nr:FAD-dependent oxidoreductase [Ramlibacter sp.]